MNDTSTNRPVTLTFGVIPKYAQFKKHTKDQFPFEMELNDNDLESISSLIDDIELFGTESEYKTLIVIDSPRRMWKLLHDMVGEWGLGVDDENSERVGDLASSIMEVLGYEWI